MKKAVSLFLCICFLVSAVSPLASAVSLSDTKDARIAAFIDGECPDGFDYVSFEPSGAQNGTVKYPLVVWLHGNSSGDYPRQQIINHDFNRWASDEYQSRFVDAGGAFLLLPRSTDGNWAATKCYTLKKTIDYYISLYADSIDTSRIYILGYSSGGSMVNHMIAAYPKFFAAAVPICSLYLPSPVEIAVTRSVSVWYFTGVFDIYVVSGAIFAWFVYFMRAALTSRPDGVRISVFTSQIWSDGTRDTKPTFGHKVWGAVTGDMHMDDGSVYPYQKTHEASGRKVSFEDGVGLIAWLSRQKRPER